MKTPCKIAALIPLRINPEKTKWSEASAAAERLCDSVIVLHDRQANDLQGFQCTEELRVEGGDGVWNDWCNRATLLARAAKYGCRWVMWLDDDETPGPTLTRERVQQLCSEAEAGGYVQVSVRVRTVWNETHYRCDGLFGCQMKTFLQLNPFALKNPCFEFAPEYRLHHFPNLDGPKLYTYDHIVHWGMRTRQLRELNTAKYEQADPEKNFSGVAYNYLLNEDGIKLRPIDPEPITLIMPTRGRPNSALAAISSVLQTASQPERIKIIVCTDEDDPQGLTLSAPNIRHLTGPRKRFIEWINRAIELPVTGWVGWLADDIRFQTQNWDAILRSHNELVVYGWDGYQNEKMATHPFIRCELPNALGFLLPESLIHGCADLFIEGIAKAVGSLAYDPLLRTEHLHPDSGKAATDETYNDAALVWPKDRETFAAVIAPEIPAMAEKVKTAMRETA